VRADDTLHYTVDFEALEAAIEERTRLFFLCNPHNPTGRVWTRKELACFADIAERHDLVICSDEIHCDLLLDGAQHIPIAALSPEIANRTITLMAPSKSFNIPGLGASFAIIPDKALREKVNRAAMGIVPHVNVLGAVAMQTAYAEGDDWLQQLQTYLTANRDFMVDFVRTRMPGVRVTRPEATYLGWLGCGDLELGKPACDFFLHDARVALNDGAWFGAGGKNFVRLNFGTTRAHLTEGLERMATALERTNS
jgi:cystathionine beta-lyase